MAKNDNDARDVFETALDDDRRLTAKERKQAEAAALIGLIGGIPVGGMAGNIVGAALPKKFRFGRARRALEYGGAAAGSAAGGYYGGKWAKDSTEEGRNARARDLREKAKNRK